MRLRNLAVAVAVVMPAVGLGGGAALADANNQFKKVPISFDAGNEGTGGGVVDSVCDSGGQCAYLVSTGTGSTLVGDLAGDWVEAYGVAVGAGGEPGGIAGAGGFTGKVKRCGTGSFLYTDEGHGTGDTIYTIVPGSGTGDLVGITGTFRQTPDPVPVTGWVRCEVHD